MTKELGCPAAFSASRINSHEFGRHGLPDSRRRGVSFALSPYAVPVASLIAIAQPSPPGVPPYHPAIF